MNIASVVFIFASTVAIFLLHQFRREGFPWIVIPLVFLFAAYLINESRIARQKKSLAGARQQLAQLNVFSEALRGTMKLEELLKMILANVQRELGFEQVYLYLLEESNDTYSLKCIACPWAISPRGIKQLSIGLTAGSGTLWSVINSRTPVRIEDTLADRGLEAEVVEVLKLRKVIVVPLVVRSEVRGVFLIGAKEEKGLESVDFSTLTIFANQVGIAIANARLFQKTVELSVIDGLTGFFNQRYFRKRLPEELELARRYAHVLSLAVADIDDFKHYNDRNGHLAGDAALRQVAAIFRKNLRKTDVAFRYGGEEFTVILPATSKEGALIILDKIRREIEEYPFRDGQFQPKGRMTISFGIATYPVDTKKPKELIEFADRAMYQAKKAGKNMITIHGMGR